MLVSIILLLSLSQNRGCGDSVSKADWPNSAVRSRVIKFLAQDFVSCSYSRAIFLFRAAIYFLDATYLGCVAHIATPVFEPSEGYACNEDWIKQKNLSRHFILGQYLNSFECERVSLTFSHELYFPLGYLWLLMSVIFRSEAIVVCIA